MTGLSPFWSADGQSVGFYAANNLKRVSIAGGSAVTLASSSVSYGGAWTSDNRILFNPGNNVPVSVISAAGGTPSPAVTLNKAAGEFLHGWPSIVPGTNWFFFFVSGPTAVRGIHVGRLGSLEHRLALPSAQGSVYSAGHVLVVRESTLEAHKFDLVTGDIAREGVAIASQVGTYSSSRGILVSASGNGHVLYGSLSPDLSRLVEYSRDGRAIRDIGPPRTFARFAVNRAGTLVVEDRPDPITGSFALWSVRLDDGSASRISTDEMSEHNPAIAPDGNTVVYQWNRDGGGQLYRRPIQGTSAPTFIGTAGLLSLPSDVSPDGQTLAFTTQGTDNDIYIARMDGTSAPTPWRKTRFNEVGAHFSPDGRWLAYQSDESGRPEIYLEQFPTGDRRQVSREGGSAASWSADGRELLYVDPQSRLMSIAALASTLPELPPPVPVLQLPRLGAYTGGFQGYVVLPGGKSLLVRVAVEDPMPFTLLLNWTALLPH